MIALKKEEVINTKCKSEAEEFWDPKSITVAAAFLVLR